ncbi:heavy-metal-associated domain-containing protein [Nonomuraea sp. KC401]|uniref:heavy-metal-associated domain-containing protein n=1 Tax=unclassified Nonomuraea TaxID=2593643 RepID=UPI0010FE8785|nr:heavy-metal-associated domain-containing protein [Nonomuraea sp. KC401]NBE94159.1 cation-transporting ATPase [Nonomuraea sp. K271]TLF79003.1 heavy-metal-associated domain-containing protein [Nonomuraea sp. KC401]
MITTTYIVHGMACGHCADAVTEELDRVPGVTAVEVHVEADRVSVTSDRELDLVHVRAAVEEAGYELTAQDT